MDVLVLTVGEGVGLSQVTITSGDRYSPAASVHCEVENREE